MRPEGKVQLLKLILELHVERGHLEAESEKRSLRQRVQKTGGRRRKLPFRVKGTGSSIIKVWERWPYVLEIVFRQNIMTKI